MTTPNTDTAKFERAIAAFVSTCATFRANEAAFQAWCAAKVIEQFGFDHVYREVHLNSKQLIASAPILGSHLKQGGNEFFPDLAVSRRPNLDVRHTSTRVETLRQPRAVLSELSIVTEFKVTGSTRFVTAPRAIRLDIYKLGAMVEACAELRPPTTYMVVLDNFEKLHGSVHYSPKRMGAQIIDKVAWNWPTHVSPPTIMIGSATTHGPQTVAYRNFSIEPEPVASSC